MSVLPKVYELVATQGLPGSGKDTWAQKFMEENPNYKRVNKDLLRAMLDFSVYSKPNEQEIIASRNLLIEHFLANKYSVISTDTNLYQNHIDTMKAIADKHGAGFRIVSLLDVPVEECIARDLARPNSVGAKVILDMYHRYVKVSEKPTPQDTKLPPAYIFDIDGTLATMVGRGPFEFDKLDQDEPNIAVRNFVWQFLPNTQVICMSGREDKYRETTSKWLKEKIHIDLGEPHNLFMRPTDDKRPDDVVKKELFDTYIKDKYNVLGVFDDRPRVIRMWRSLGLPTFGVGNDIEF